MSNIRDTPYTEIVERVQLLSRSSSDDKKKIRDIVNRKYASAIPREMDWYFLKASSSISCVAEHDSGVVTVNTQNTVCTFSGTVITSAMTGRKIKFSNNANIYDFTYSDSTGGTISPSLSLAANISMGAYTIFKSIFSLAPDFDRFPINGGLLYYSGGKPTPLPEVSDDDYYNDYATASPSSTPERCRLLDYDTAGNQQVEIISPPADAMVLPYEYLRTLPPMKESSGGTVVVTGTSVTGTATKFTEMTTGDYFRQDFIGTGVDSQWYKILTITHDSSLQLRVSTGSDNAAEKEYVISTAPKYPHKFQEALIYGAMGDLLPDQNDPNYVYYHGEYAKILTDNKVIIQTRKTKDDIELIAENINYRR